MSFYSERILPRIIARTCGMPAMDGLRRRTCAPLSGRIVEIGFGSGFNVPAYPESVTEVHAVEPSDSGWRLGRVRVDAASIPIRRAGLDGERLPFDDDTFDSALSTFTLCTIPDVAGALTELRRVVRPGGVFAFLEHGSAPDAGVRTWQRRIEPFQKRLGGGCHLTRRIPTVIAEAGWELGAVDEFYTELSPRPFGAFVLGSAHVPGRPDGG